MVQLIMESWTHQLGYPLVTLHRHGDLIHASQKHFLLVNSSMHRNVSQKWHIPLTFTTSDSPKSENQIWMRGRDGKQSKLFRFENELAGQKFKQLPMNYSLVFSSSHKYPV